MTGGLVRHCINNIPSELHDFIGNCTRVTVVGGKMANGTRMAMAKKATERHPTSGIGRYRMTFDDHPRVKNCSRTQYIDIKLNYPSNNPKRAPREPHKDRYKGPIWVLQPGFMLGLT